MNVIKNDLTLPLIWSDWTALKDSWKGKILPETQGLYRIKRVDLDGIDYIGQTGTGTMNLKKRAGMLRSVYKEEMPYNDPHTAGPGLWALLKTHRSEFLISTLTTELTTQERKGLECLAISEHRIKYEISPTINFGRMPNGFRKSSGNNKKLVEKGKRFKGGFTGTKDTNHLPGIASIGKLKGDPDSLNWCGHQWSEWMSFADINRVENNFTGLYRIKGNNNVILYIGEGKIKNRLNAHFIKTMKQDNKQGRILLDQSPLAFSYVSNLNWKPNQRQELENDLIAAYIIYTNKIPEIQFLG